MLPIIQRAKEIGQNASPTEGREKLRHTNPHTDCGGHINFLHGDSRTLHIDSVGRKGHLQRICHSKPWNISNDAHHLATSDPGRTCGDEIQQWSWINAHNKELQMLELFVTVFINGHKHKMEIDSGSRVSITNEDDFKQLYTEGPSPKLSKPAYILCSYDRQMINLPGSYEAGVQYGCHQAKPPFIVAKGQCKCLLGRYWFNPLGITNPSHSCR